MSFESALSGLKAAQVQLDVIGNNISNSSTTAYKQSSVQFSDVVASGSLGSGNQVGSGVKLASVLRDNSQGNLTFTDNPLDLAIEGDGFFRINKDGAISYTRAGAFGVNKDGFIVNASGERLTGFQAATDGTITGVIGDLYISNADLEPKATSTMTITANVDASAKMPNAAWVGTSTFGGTTPASNTYNNTNLATVYDSLGTAHTLTTYFIKAGSANTWEVRLQMDGVDVSSTAVSGSNSASSLVSAGSLDVMASGELTINGTNAGAASSDSSSTTDASASAKAIATAINAVTFSPTVTAVAQTTRYNLGTFTTGTLGSGDFQINGQNVVISSATKGALLTAINALNATTGVTATENNSGEIVLTASDGRNIQLTSDGTAVTSTFSNYSLSVAQDMVQQGEVLLKSAGNITIAGTDPADAGFTAGTISSQEAEAFNLTFNADGSLNEAASDTVSLTWTPLDATGVANGATAPQTITVDLSSTKRLGSAFNVSDISQNGYATGRLSNIDIDSSGIILGRYTNGESQNLGQITLVSFRNPQGLSPAGNSSFSESVASGVPISGTPDTGSLGSIQSGALEESNVPLTDSLVELIQAQRFFQANAQTIRTEDDVNQAVINIR